MERQVLPRRRPAFTTTVILLGQECELTIGPFDDGRPGEVFLTKGFKEGSDMAFLLDDVCILISLALQFGRTAGELKRTMGTQSLAGQIIDVVWQYDDSVLRSVETPLLPGLETPDGSDEA